MGEWTNMELNKSRMHSWCMYDRIMTNKRYYIEFLEWTIYLEKWTGKALKRFMKIEKIQYDKSLDINYTADIFNEFIEYEIHDKIKTLSKGKKNVQKA